MFPTKLNQSIERIDLKIQSIEQIDPKINRLNKSIKNIDRLNKSIKNIRNSTITKYFIHSWQSTQLYRLTKSIIPKALELVQPPYIEPWI